MRNDVRVVAVAAVVLAAGIAGAVVAGWRALSLGDPSVFRSTGLPGLDAIETRIEDWTYPGADILMSVGGTFVEDRSPAYLYGASHAMSTADDFGTVVARYWAMLEGAAKARSTRSATLTMAPGASAPEGSNTSSRFENGILVFATTEPYGDAAGKVRRALLGLRSRNARVDLFIGRGDGDSRTRITLIYDEAPSR